MEKPAPADKGGLVFASPLARRMAELEGLDLSRIEGSGPRGRVVKRDIEKALAEGKLQGLQGEGEPLPDRAGEAFTDIATAVAARIMAEALCGLWSALDEVLTEAERSLALTDSRRA